MLCRSAGEDAGLSLVGRIAFRDLITEALISRLLRVEAVKTRRHVFDTPLVPPLIIVGARSGTTFLHRLLCCEPRARPLALWEVLRPMPPLGPDRRHDAVRRQVAAIKRLYPGVDTKHLIDADQPEEDIFLLNSSFKSAGFYMMGPVYSYVEWLRSQDLSSAYLEYLQHLQLFQAEDPSKRLTLKAPAHLYSMRALLAAIPNALVVQTHREPVEVLGSMNSFMQTMHAGICDDFDKRRMAATNTGILEELISRGEKDLATVSSEQVIHIRYRDLVKNPIETVRDIYRHFGLDFTEELESRLCDFVAGRPQNKYGRHVYSVEDFGLSEAEVFERFADYRARNLDTERASS